MIAFYNQSRFFINGMSFPQSIFMVICNVFNTKFPASLENPNKYHNTIFPQEI